MISIPFKLYDRIVAFVVVALLGFAPVGMCMMCTPSGPPPKTEAEMAYEAEQDACVTVYAKRAEIDACRAKSKAKWAQWGDGGAR
jgi:hypothetical protein